MFELKFISHNIKKTVIIFLIGFCIYPAIEIIWNTILTPMNCKIFVGLFSMGVLGGVLLVILGNLNEIKFIREKCPVFIQALLGGLIITLLEFLMGLIVNVWLGWNVWDYANMPFNIMGQVCLLYSVLWVVLSPLAFWLDDIFREAYSLLNSQCKEVTSNAISLKRKILNIKLGSLSDLSLRYRNFFNIF